MNAARIRKLAGVARNAVALGAMAGAMLTVTPMASAHVPPTPQASRAQHGAEVVASPSTGMNDTTVVGAGLAMAVALAAGGLAVGVRRKQS